MMTITSEQAKAITYCIAIILYGTFAAHSAQIQRFPLIPRFTSHFYIVLVWTLRFGIEHFQQTNEKFKIAMQNSFVLTSMELSRPEHIM